MFCKLVRLAVVACSLSALAAQAEDAFYDVRIADLQLTEGKIESNPNPPKWNRQWSMYSQQRPKVTVEGAEAYWYSESYGDFRYLGSVDQWGTVHVRMPDASKDVVGRFDYPNKSEPGYMTVRFKIPASQAKLEARDTFWRAKAQHYDRLVSDGVPGTAWFRHEAREARAKLQTKGSTTSAAATVIGSVQPTTNFDDTFSFASGNRAVSENLQLDRVLPAARAETGTVKLDTIKGITLAEIDWKKEIEGKKPTLDSLASYIPADQHVVFFPTFASALQLADEADRQGTALVQVAATQSAEMGLVERYQRQLGLRTTAIGRMLGPQVIESLAITGGDPYFEMGTDVAIVFDAVDVPALKAALTAQIVLNTSSEKDVKHETGDAGGTAYEVWRTADRAVCSHLAAYGEAVVVTNSLVQLQKLIETHQGKAKSIASLDEFTFFRDRYRRGDAGETAFLFLSDPTIRRWCGPRWRIADSRRVRDLAVLSELQAQFVPKLATRTAEAGPIYTELKMADSSEARLTPAGVVSPAAGSLTFMTPISEIPLDEVTKAEATAYERWRDGYQRNFSWACDPIGLRLTVADDRLGGDMTIMPLIDNSDYREFIEIAQGVKLKPNSGDPHGALLHAVLAFNKDSERMKGFAGFASTFAPQLRVDPLSWIGESVSVYVDDGPFWDELLKVFVESQGKLSETELRREVMKRTGYQIPIALRIEVGSPFKAAAFVTGVRAFIEQTVPGMTRWETINHGDSAYVKISPTKGAIGDEEFQKLALYYALTPEAWTLSLSEAVIKKSLDRSAAAAKAGDGAEKKDAAGAATAEWLGDSFAMDVKLRDGKILAAVTGDEYQAQLKRISWGNLPILNEWHRLFPHEDAVALHQRLWGMKLVCPAGGQYVWNEKWQTMESTVLGHPGEPKSSGPSLPPQLREFTGARYGLTFEPHGLRARAELLRKK